MDVKAALSQVRAVKAEVESVKAALDAISDKTKEIAAEKRAKLLALAAALDHAVADAEDAVDPAHAATRAEIGRLGDEVATLDASLADPGLDPDARDAAQALRTQDLAAKAALELQLADEWTGLITADDAKAIRTLADAAAAETAQRKTVAAWVDGATKILEVAVEVAGKLAPLA